eukprot:g63000.t1
MRRKQAWALLILLLISLVLAPYIYWELYFKLSYRVDERGALARPYTSLNSLSINASLQHSLFVNASVGDSLSMNILWIAGTIRSSARFWEKARKNLERLEDFMRAHVIQTRVVIFENDSRDRTTALVRKWVIENPDRSRCFMSEKLGLKQRSFCMKSSTDWRYRCLAYGRNRLLNYIRSHPAFTAVHAKHTLLMVDMDNVLAHFTEQAWFTSLLETLREPPFDVTCANQVDFYYDRWALRTDAKPLPCSPPWPGTCFENLTTWFPNTTWIKEIPTTAPPVRVQSCFGGMALYALERTKGCGYFVKGSDCEHVPFHACLSANNVSIGIKPSFLNAGQPPEQ